MNKTSEVHKRMRTYATMCDELHLVVLGAQQYAEHSYGNLFLYSVSGNKIAQRFVAYRLARFILTHKSPDIVSAQSPDELGLIAYLVARSQGVKLQLQVHTDICSPWYRRAGIVPRIKYILARFLLSRADCIRVVSERIAQSLIDELHISPSIIIRLPIFTDVQQLMRQDTRVSNNARDSRTQGSACAMIGVGRFVEKEKNFSMLIRAMVSVVKTCPMAILVIVGDGPDKEYYQSLITIFNLERNIFLEPWRNDLHRFYSSFDLLVVPSYIEGWGRVVIEGMASGLAVIMTDVGLAGEVVQNGVNGRIIPVADQLALVAAMSELCMNPKIRTRLAKAALESVHNLSVRTKEEYLNQWKKSFDCCTLKNL